VGQRGAEVPVLDGRGPVDLPELVEDPEGQVPALVAEPPARP
jgi:hypothetical protein